MDDDLKSDAFSIFLNALLGIEDGVNGIVVLDLFGPSQDHLNGRVLGVQTRKRLVFRAIGAIGIDEAHLLN